MNTINLEIDDSIGVPFKPIFFCRSEKRKHAPTMVRFFRKVNRAVGCWNWNAFKSADGYGKFQIGGKNSPTRNAHRFLYEVIHGAIPQGWVVRHKCDNAACVNPDHLVAGTQYENIQDKVMRGRQTRGETHGMVKLTEKQAREIKASTEDSLVVAKRYGIVRATVNNIRAGRIWRHL